MKLSSLAIVSLISAASTTAVSAKNKKMMKDEKKQDRQSKMKAGKAAKIRDSDPEPPMPSELDDCVFANPAIKQAKALQEPTGSENLDFLIGHALLVNKIFYKKVSEWTMEEIDSQQVFDKGKMIGEIHESFFESLDADDETKLALICSMADILVMQMKDTCDYYIWMDAYKSVSAVLIDGFAYGAGYDEGCEFGGEDDDSEGGGWEGDDWEGDDQQR